MMGGPKATVEDLPATSEEHEEAAVRDEKDEVAHLAAIVVKRRKLELARTDVTRRLELAHADAHRETLRLALQALDQELDRLI
jgi:hypothetical protein